jgi:hypothetical protein
MKITSHLEHGHDHEEVEVISIKYVDVVFERDEETAYQTVLSNWVVETIYRHGNFYEETVTLIRASVIHRDSREKLCKAELSEEEEEKIKDYISNIEIMYP